MIWRVCLVVLVVDLLIMWAMYGCTMAAHRHRRGRFRHSMTSQLRASIRRGYFKTWVRDVTVGVTGALVGDFLGGIAALVIMLFAAGWLIWRIGLFLDVAIPFVLWARSGWKLDDEA